LSGGRARKSAPTRSDFAWSDTRSEHAESNDGVVMMQKTWRMIWLMLLSALMFLGAAFVTLRAAEQPSHAAPVPAHPAASKPEESATIPDDPTIAPDPSQSADNDISFPTDI
jgi:hypothetical protein